jgi:hypothetical protein
MAQGATKITVNFETYWGGRFVGCGLTLHFIPGSTLQIMSKAIYPEDGNYEYFVFETIKRTCEEKNFIGQFIVEKIDFHQANSSQRSFEKLAEQAVNAIYGLLH